MPQENVTTKFIVDLSEFKSGITEANRQIKLANAQFKAASAGMDDWENSADGLRAKIQQLDSIIAAQTKKLKAYQDQLDAVEKAQQENEKRADELKTAYQQAAQQFGENSTEAKTLKKALSDVEKEAASNAKAADDLKVKILNQTAEVKKAEKQHRDYSDRLQDVENNSDETADSAKTLSKEIKKAGDSADNANDGFTVLKGALADLVADGIKNAIDGFKEMVTAVLDLSEATREYRSMQATIAGSANSFGYSVEFAKDQYKEFYSYLADDQMATNAITNLLGMKVTTETVSAAADAAIAVWSAYGDSIPIESLTESINESAQVAKVTGVLADALNWAGISEDDFNLKLEKCNSTQERADLIAQTLNSTYNNSRKTYDELNQSTLDYNSSALELRDTQAELGAIVEPVNAKLAELKNKILEPLVPLVQTASNEFIRWAESVDWDAVGDEIVNGVGKAKEIFQWIVNNKDEIVGAIAAIASGFLVFKSLTFLATIAGAIVKIVTAVKGATTVFGALSAVMAALGGPVTVVIALITGLVAGFVYLWNTCEPFKQFWVDLGTNITSFLSTAGQAIVTFFTVTLPVGIQAVLIWFQQLPSRIVEFFTQVLTNVQIWATNMIAKAQEVGSNFLNDVVNFFSQLPYNVGNFLGMVIGNVAAWVVNMTNKAIEVGTNFLNNVVNFFMQLPGNVLNFITTTFNNIVAWGSNMISKAREVGSNFLNNVVNFFTQLPGRILSFLTTALNAVVQWGTNLWNAGKSAAQQLVDAVVETISTLPEKMIDIGTNLVKGLWNGITSAGSWLKNQISGFANGIIDGFKSAFKVNSPSKLMADEVGKWLPAGIAEGINKNLKVVKDAAANMTSAVSFNSSKSGSIASHGSGGKSVTFYQTINSPKALSRLEIYRQTRNQLQLVKGVV